MTRVAAAAVAIPELAPGSLLSIRDLAVRFGPLVALAGIDLEVREGELIVLAGENGAGKTTLVRCVAGEIGPFEGEIRLFGELVVPGRRPAGPRDVAMVWQDLALCDNLDIAENLVLGREQRFWLRSEARLHNSAARLLASLRIPLYDTTRSVRSLTGAQRQLLAVARAIQDRPRLLILDEPTTALGVQESADVEELIAEIRQQGVTILLVSHDVDQMFRLADRIVVLRGGRVVADVDPGQGHPDDIAALMSGQAVDSSARGQLTRLHGLVDRLASSDRSSSLSLILSTLGAALGIEHLSIHLVAGGSLCCLESLGFPATLLSSWRKLPYGSRGALSVLPPRPSRSSST